jgi:selenide, water dikinase
MARGSGCSLAIEWSKVPLLPGVHALAENGFITGASARNWASYGKAITLPEGFPDSARALLTDPQTSGGLLVACAPEASDRVCRSFADHGFAAEIIGGVIEAGEAGPNVTILS